jgi:hypothetical protein
VFYYTFKSNKQCGKKRKERSYNRCNLTFLHTYLLFSNKMRSASVARIPGCFFLSFHTSASVLFHLTFKPKREYKSENKNVRKLRTLLLKHIHIKCKKKKRMTVIFKKKEKKFALYSPVFVRADE